MPRSGDAEEPKYTFQAYDIIMSGASCSARTAKFVRIADQAVRAGEGEQAADIYVNVAGCHAEAGRTAMATKYLSKAIALGFDDCQALNTDKRLKNLPGFRSFRARAKQSPADLHEVMWLDREMGTGTNYGARQRAVTMSRMIASRAAAARARAVTNRRYRPSGKSTRPIACTRY